MRGKASVAVIKISTPRITPACAGKSQQLLFFFYQHSDHPRVCGEKYPKPTWKQNSLGSPPRVRGKVTDNLFLTANNRITPACAGKSIKLNPINVRSKDHPRVCGEKFWQIVIFCPVTGSPPRVRGKERICRRIRLRYRITPACAGKSQ